MKKALSQEDWEIELKILLAKFAMYLDDTGVVTADDHDGEIKKFSDFIQKTIDQAGIQALERVGREVIGEDDIEGRVFISRDLEDIIRSARNDLRSEQHAALAKMKEGV